MNYDSHHLLFSAVFVFIAFDWITIHVTVRENETGIRSGAIPDTNGLPEATTGTASF
jgi:hypothetical protein